MICSGDTRVIRIFQTIGGGQKKITVSIITRPFDTVYIYFPKTHTSTQAANKIKVMYHEEGKTEYCTVLVWNFNLEIFNRRHGESTLLAIIVHLIWRGLKAAKQHRNHLHTNEFISHPVVYIPAVPVHIGKKTPKNSSVQLKNVFRTDISLGRHHHLL